LTGPQLVTTSTTACYGGFSNVSYIYNFYFMDDSMTGSSAANSIPLQMSQLQTPSNDAILFDAWGAASVANPCGLGWLGNTLNALKARTAGSTVFNTLQPYQVGVVGHNNGGNAAYVDGHVKWYSTGYYMAQVAADSGTAIRTFGADPTIFHE
jgi:prepilin-type processing-associated H-X9-DG protein